MDIYFAISVRRDGTYLQLLWVAVVLDRYENRLHETRPCLTRDEAIRKAEEWVKGERVAVC